MSPSESDFDIPAKNCYRMVILGSTKVGKTAIVSRFLNGRFEEQYTPTIEDFHRKLYSIKGDVYQLDILDTSGNHPFPAMRRLSILTGTYPHLLGCVCAGLQLRIFRTQPWWCKRDVRTVNPCAHNTAKTRKDLWCVFKSKSKCI